MKDGTYIESEFYLDKPVRNVLVVKPNGVYFEGKIDELAKNRKSGFFNGIFRNPVLKRQSMNQKDPERSKRMNFGKNCFGYCFKDEMRYKGFLGKGKNRNNLLGFMGEISLPDGKKRLGLIRNGFNREEIQIIKNDYKLLQSVDPAKIKNLNKHP